MASRVTYIPAGHVSAGTFPTPVVTRLTGGEVVALTTASTTALLAAHLNNATLPLNNTGLALVSPNATGLVNISLTGLTAFPTAAGANASVPGRATVWRAATPWAPWKAIAYPVANGTCPVSGTGFSQCFLSDAAIKLLAGAGTVLRAGLVTSGAVAGSMDASIPAADRRGVSITTSDGAGAVSAQHGYLLETGCSRAGSCTVLGVNLPDSMSADNSSMTLGWAVYNTAVAAPPPPRASAPTIAGAMDQTAYIEISVCGVLLALALVASVLICRRIIRKARERDAKTRKKEAAEEGGGASGSESDDERGGDGGENKWRTRMQYTKLRI